MSNLPSVLAWIVGALLLGGGFAAGYVVGSDEGPSLPEDVTALDHGSGPATTPPPELRREASDGPRLESQTAAELEPLREALATLPVPVVETGTGVITGTVTTDKGQPLAGVTVQASPRFEQSQKRPAQGSQGGEVDADLPLAVKRYVDSLRRRRLGQRKVVTRGDGTYRFDDLTDRAHHITASLDGWKLQATGRAAWKAEPGATVDFTAKPVTRVPIEVFLPDGSVPERAQLMFRSTPGGGRGHSWRPDAVHATVDPGVYQVTATAGSSNEYRGGPVTVTVEEGVAAPLLRIDLEGRPVLKGTVTFPEGERTKGGTVRCARIPKGAAADPTLLTSRAKESPLRNWNADEPAFTFVDLVPGRYLLGFARNYGGPVVATKTAELSIGLTEVVLDVPPLARQDYVVLRVRGPDGEPVLAPRINTGFRSKGGSSSGGSTVIDRKDGTQWILHHGGSNTGTDGTYWIQVTDARYGTLSAEYEAGSAPTLDLRFEPPASLEVTIVGLTGTEWEGLARVSLVRSEEAGRNASDPTALAFRRLGMGAGTPGQIQAGKARFEGLQPGPHDIVLSLTSGRFAGQEIARKAVTLTAGSNRARLSMPPLHDVAVEGLTVRCHLSRKDKPGWHQTVVPADGRALLKGLPAGEYRLHHGASEPIRFQVPGTTTVRVP